MEFYSKLCSQNQGKFWSRSELLFTVMQKTVSAFHGNDEVCNAMLRCLVSFV